MNYLLYLFTSILLLTSCRKVTYTPFLKTNLSFTSVSEPQKHWSARSDYSALPTPPVSEPVTPDYRAPLLSHQELNFPALQKRPNKPLTRQVIHKVNKLQSRELKEKDPRKLEPLAVISTALAGLSFPLIVFQNTLTVFILLNVAAIVTGLIAASKIRRNKTRYRGKGWAITGIALGVYLLVGTFVLYLLIRSFLNNLSGI